MCRYSEHEYKSHWVCLPCRTSFKHFATWPHGPIGAGPLCPHCGGSMRDFGHDFQPPRKSESLQWKKLKVLAVRHTTFDSCGCTGPGYRPKTFAEAKHPYVNPWPQGNQKKLQKKLV